MKALWDAIGGIRADLARLTARVPLRHVATPTSSLNFIRVVGGNTLTTGQAGVKYVYSLIATVPSLYDAAVDTSFIDGIGRGSLYAGGVYQGIVLFALDPSCTLNRALVVGDVFVVAATKAVPLASDATQSVTVWIPLFI